MKRLVVICGLNVAMLLAIGVMALAAASDSEFAPHRLQSHLRHIGIGLALATVVACLDSSRLRRWCPPSLILGLAVAALVAVFIPGIGVEVNHARRWLRWGGQPSAFASLALIFFLAHYGAGHHERMSQRNQGFLCPVAIAGAIIALIFLEPDWGTAILTAAVAAGMLFVAGTHWGYLLAAAIVAAELFALCLCFNPGKFHRLISFLDPEKYQYGAGWQGWASVLSLGVGGWWGHPDGGRLKYQHVPEQNNDFILSRLGEEYGFAGTTLVLLNYASLIAVGLFLVWRTRDLFSRLLALGLTLLIAFQAFINIGVATSSLPNKGIPLPFISDGGSSLVALLLAAGLLVAIARGTAHHDKTGHPCDPGF